MTFLILKHEGERRIAPRPHSEKWYGRHGVGAPVRALPMKSSVWILLPPRSGFWINTFKWPGDFSMVDPVTSHRSTRKTSRASLPKSTFA